MVRRQAVGSILWGCENTSAWFVERQSRSRSAQVFPETLHLSYSKARGRRGGFQGLETIPQDSALSEAYLSLRAENGVPALAAFPTSALLSSPAPRSGVLCSRDRGCLRAWPWQCREPRSIVLRLRAILHTDRYWQLCLHMKHLLQVPSLHQQLMPTCDIARSL